MPLDIYPCFRHILSPLVIAPVLVTVYGRDLQTDITQDISRGFEDMVVEILKCEREQGDAVDFQLAKNDAYRLYKVDNVKINVFCLLARQQIITFQYLYPCKQNHSDGWLACVKTFVELVVSTVLMKFGTLD